VSNRGLSIIRVAKNSERELLDGVVKRLVAKFSELPAGLIPAAVEDAYVHLTHSVIRDYIPLLVERRAHKKLALLAASPDRSRELTPTA
jgi:hypothetical protein